MNFWLFVLIFLMMMNSNRILTSNFLSGWEISVHIVMSCIGSFLTVKGEKWWCEIFYLDTPKGEYALLNNVCLVWKHSLVSPTIMVHLFLPSIKPIVTLPFFSLKHRKNACEINNHLTSLFLLSSIYYFHFLRSGMFIHI